MKSTHTAPPLQALAPLFSDAELADLTEDLGRFLNGEWEGDVSYEFERDSGDVVTMDFSELTTETFDECPERAFVADRQQMADAGVFLKEANSDDVRSPISNREPWEARGEDLSILIQDFLYRFYNWPCRVEHRLFVVDRGKILWLDTATALISWYKRFVTVNWHRGEAKGYVSEAQFLESLQQTVHEYEGVEHAPHVPPLKEHYYLCGDPVSGDGSRLEELLNFFCPETSLDRDLMRAAFTTPLWGGPPGARPILLLTAPSGRGAGKTTFTQAVARVYGGGGAIDAAPGGDIDILKQRILSPGAESKRIVAVDNVKTTRFSWPEFEALVTADVVSGKRMYFGEAGRPNYLTYFVTLNGPSLAVDLVQRVCEIRVAKPAYESGWLDRMTSFIDTHREKIIGDLAALLRQPAREVEHGSRWSLWERDVLGRCCDDLAKCLELIIRRREDADVEAEEGVIVEEYFAGMLKWLGYDIERDDVFIPSSIVAEWYNAATGDKKKVTGAIRTLRQMKDEGRVWRLVYTRTKKNRGVRWVGPHSTTEDFTEYDLAKRLAKKKEEKSRGFSESEEAF
ncbi:MAG: hypothetical protein ACYTG0_25905 [Planctomycetota bacterium]|jgi:hypothetical protein